MTSAEVMALSDASPQLTNDDVEWLSPLGVQVDAWQLNDINELLAIGSQTISPAPRISTEVRERVVDARIKFFEDFLGWGSPNSELYTAYIHFKGERGTAIPLGTFIEAQRVLHERQINASKFMAAVASGISFTSQTLEYRFKCMDELGLDAAEVVNSYPPILGYAPQTLADKFDQYEAWGLCVPKTINKFPDLVGYGLGTVAERMEYLTSLGFDAKRIINKTPAIIGMSPEVIDARLENLRSHGLDAVKTVSVTPSLLRLSIETVNEKMAFLAERNMLPAKVIKGAPTLLGCSIEALDEKINTLEACGLDAVRIANKYPRILTCAPDSVRAKVSYIRRVAEVLGWQGDVVDLINGFPALLGYSRIKLRTHARLFAEHGRATYTRQDVAKFIAESLESHLILLNKGQPYEASAIYWFSRDHDGGTRKEMVANAGFDQLEARVGEKAIRHYGTYRA